MSHPLPFGGISIAKDAKKLAGLRKRRVIPGNAQLDAQALTDLSLFDD